MPTYKEFEGINLIADPTQKTIAEVLVKNELGGASDGYKLIMLKPQIAATHLVVIKWIYQRMQMVVKYFLQSSKLS